MSLEANIAAFHTKHLMRSKVQFMKKQLNH